MPVESWHPETVIRASKSEIARRMKSAALFVQGDVKKLIRAGVPASSIRRTKRGNIYTTQDAAPAPTPPRSISGRLLSSITHSVEIGQNEIVGRVGSNLPYARRLELGFFGADSRGRNINQGERPYLRPALRDNITRIFRILAGGGA